MPQVILNDRQQELRQIIETNLDLVRSDINGNSRLSDEEHALAFNRMADAAHELHMSLDPHPRHHRYMIKNSRMQPEDPNFYRHIHPVEDLLKYLDDTDANIDPEDVTIGATFTLSIYSRRWGHGDSYPMTRTVDGWRCGRTHYTGDCDKEGGPFLYNAMSHEGITWPTAVPSMLRQVWNEAYEQGLASEQLQTRLNLIADYISKTERNMPDGFDI